MELLQVLLQHFEGSVYPGTGREILYPRDPPYALHVHFNKCGELTAAHAGEALTPDARRALLERINREFVASTGLGVNRQAYFSMAPVHGWWRYQDRFQILPVPEEAPKADFVLLDHPFLIEFRYARAPDFFLDSCKRTRLVSKLALLLNALLVSPVQTLGGCPPGSVRFAWVLLPPEQNGADPKIAYRQEGYYYDGMCEPAEDFTPVAHLPPIREVSPSEYYRGERRSHKDPLEVPSDLVASLDRFYALEVAAQDRFLNACYWLSQANLRSSWSMTFLAAVQAIETLIDWGTGGTNRQHGGKRRPGSTQLFVSFLKRYVPASQVGEDAQRMLYEIRSGLTHGKSPPFLMNTEIIGILNPASDKQSEYLTLALTAARVGLRNWLHAAG
jgi:hypothetical protein